MTLAMSMSAPGAPRAASPLARASLRAGASVPGTAAGNPAITSESLSRLINLAGRQRMLSQRLVLHCVLASHGQADAVEGAMGLLTQLRHSQRLLEDGGGGLPGLFSAGLREVFDGAPNARMRIASFMSLADRAVQELREGRPLGERLQGELVAQATAVLEPLNLVTQAFEQEAQELARRQSRERERLNEEIRSVAREARVVAFNAQVSAHRAGGLGAEFAVVAARMATITEEMDELVRASVSVR